MQVLRCCSLATLVLALAACVTINVYFPAVAAERAADRVIQDVWGRQTEPGQPQESPAPAAPPQPEPSGWLPSRHFDLGAVLGVLIADARAAEPSIEVSSPVIRRITAAMEQRFRKLKPYYESGAIGLTQDARVAIRDLSAVPLSERGQVHQLVAAQNAERDALYREIARANQHPEWEGDIRRVFAERWIAKAPDGWYYRNQSGAWVRK